MQKQCATCLSLSPFRTFVRHHNTSIHPPQMMTSRIHHISFATRSRNDFISRILTAVDQTNAATLTSQTREESTTFGYNLINHSFLESSSVFDLCSFLALRHCLRQSSRGGGGGRLTIIKLHHTRPLPLPRTSRRCCSQKVKQLATPSFHSLVPLQVCLPSNTYSSSSSKRSPSPLHAPPRLKHTRKILGLDDA